MLSEVQTRIGPIRKLAYGKGVADRQLVFPMFPHWEILASIALLSNSLFLLFLCFVLTFCIPKLFVRRLYCFKSRRRLSCGAGPLVEQTSGKSNSPSPPCSLLFALEICFRVREASGINVMCVWSGLEMSRGWENLIMQMDTLSDSFGVSSQA